MHEKFVFTSQNSSGQDVAAEKPPRSAEPMVEGQANVRKLFNIAKASESSARKFPIEQEVYDLLNEMTKGELAEEVDPMIAKANLIGLSKVGQLYRDAVARRCAAKLSDQSGIDSYHYFHKSERYWSGLTAERGAKITEASDRGYLLGARGVSRSKKSV